MDFTLPRRWARRRVGRRRRRGRPAGRWGRRGRWSWRRRVRRRRRRHGQWCGVNRRGRARGWIGWRRRAGRRRGRGHWQREEGRRRDEMLGGVEIGQIGQDLMHARGVDTKPLGERLPNSLPRRGWDETPTAGVERPRVAQVVRILSEDLAALDGAAEDKVVAAPACTRQAHEQGAHEQRRAEGGRGQPRAAEGSRRQPAGGGGRPGGSRAGVCILMQT